MNTRKFLNLAVSLLVIAVMLFGRNVPAGAMPASPTDGSKVPHYFGPYPNWANSPFTLPDATVTINGDGAGAKAVAKVGGNGVITGIDVIDPGVGYTAATVDITSANGSGAAATATVTPSGIVTSVTVNVAGAGYTKPVVSLSGGGGTGTLIQVGNPIAARANATDFATPPGVLGPVFVVVPTAMPASGFVQGIQYFNQATAGGSPNPSAGNLFHAYVLHATGTPNQYTVLWDSGEQTVPAAVDPVGDILTIAVPNIAVTTGDAIAFYGEGIPFDTGTGADIISTPASVPPVLNGTITVGDPGTFPLLAEARTYSFAASVVDTSGVVPLTNATATAYGGVDHLNLTNGGSGYTMPTVDFDLPDDPNGVQAKAHVPSTALGDPIDGLDPNGTITAIIVDSPGSGYLASPNVVIRDGTIFDPINNGGSGATATATLAITTITLDTYGAGYTSSPTISITDPTGSAATASATISAGGVTGVTVTTPGSGYTTQGGIKKFQDGLPVLCIPAAGQTFADCTNNNLGQHIPVAVPDTTTFSTANGFSADADYYVIAVVQHRERMSSSLPAAGSLLREYVQLETPANAGISKHVALQTDLLDGTSVPALMPDGSQAVAVDDPHYLGPVIVATKDKPVRIVFYNLLPTGAEGDLFLPVDSTMMGSGMGPMTMMDPADQGSVMDMVRNPECTEYPKANGCFKDNRATLHLHGGNTPWISDGTPHQWITPANETTPWPQGVSVQAVPDMTGVAGVPDCTSSTDGCMSFYYTNQQSARLMFYHDHAWGITRLNVYAGEAAGYLITDATEQKLVNSGVIPADQIPLIIQDRTFVPDAPQLAAADPTWDSARWGGYGNLWYHHVYMPAQNPGDPSGMSAYGRWMYGPWFWPPAKDAKYPPIANPYYDPNCNLDDPATWQYQTDPFCEPQLIPGTPNISVGMEQFNDTPLVNGTAYPTTTVDPKSYRLRILNAANDRFWNLQWYVADPTTGTNSEVALKAAELAAAQTDPNVYPTPDTAKSPVGPSWIQIGTEGGFLPAPAVVPNQPITWIIDPTRFDFGNVDKHALLLAPAERADVIVDFSKYAGKTLILYNDAPAAFPARVASYDYYTGAPDLSPVGAPGILPGYGPNTRTIMQVKVAATAPAAAFNLTALNNAFKHHADGSGVFESGQHPIIVGQSGYNSAYGSNFISSGWCNAASNPTSRCDGYVRISEQGGDQFAFNTLRAPSTKLSIPLQPKALHDEMNAASFDEFGRMTANIGLEAVPATPGLQNVILYPYVNPSTELIDATNLPKGDVKVTPIGSADGTQIWKITHNGVDTHPIHFHLYDVQLLNRVTWDNIIMPPEASELGWKDTLRVSPLQDTIVALRPIIPAVPFELPNSIRELNPMMPDGSTAMFNNTDAAGNPTAGIVNKLVNFGWEYVYHCHILSHEEMDMMRPVSVALPPIAPDGLAYAAGPGGSGLVLTWNDNSINETGFVVQKMEGVSPWTDLATIPSPLDQANTHGVRTYLDSTFVPGSSGVSYRIVAQNAVGYGGDYMSLTVQSVSAVVAIPSTLPPSAPTNLTITLIPGPQFGLAPLDGHKAGLALPVRPATILAQQAGPQIQLSWTDNSLDETGFVVERSDNGGAFAQIAAPVAQAGTGTVTFTDSTVTAGNTYDYRAYALNAIGPSGFSNTATLNVPPLLPAAPTGLTAVLQAGPQVLLSWTDSSLIETGFGIERSVNGGAFTLLTTQPALNGTGGVTYTDLAVAAGNAYSYRVYASNPAGPSPYTNTAAVNIPLPAPTGLIAALQAGPQVLLTWTDNATNETGFVVERSDNGGAFAQIAAPAALAGTGTVTFTDSTVVPGNTYDYRVAAVNANGPSAYSNTATVAVPIPLPAAPTGLTAVLQAGPQVLLTWTDNATNETGFGVERSVNGGAFALLTTQPALSGTGSVTYTDAAVTAGNIYAYRVNAVNTTGPSSYTNTASVNIPLPAPTGLTATALAGPQVRLSWTDNATNETGFVVQRSVNGGTFTQIAAPNQLPGTGTVTINDTTVAIGVTYAYRVYAVNANGPSANSNTVSVTVPIPPRPAAPTNITATLQNGPQIRLTWRDNSSVETGFVIQRSVNGGAFATLVTRPALAGTGTVAYIDTTVVAGRTYRYRVAATNSGVLSAYVTSATVSVPTLPVAPSGLNGTAARSGTTDTVTLRWTDRSNNETGFIIQRATNSTFTAGLTSQTVGANATSYAWTGLARRTRYYFRIAATNASGNSTWSSVISIVTP